MNLHIDLKPSHPAYAWLEKQADKIGAGGHFGTHIDCYTSTPQHSEYNLPIHILDCTGSMPTPHKATSLPLLSNRALVLYTGNMAANDYGTKSYFDNTDTSISEDTLKIILEKQPQFILIDSYGIGKHGNNHIALDKMCEQAECFIIENIRLTPEMVDKIQSLLITFDLNYPSTGKPCKVISM